MNPELQNMIEEYFNKHKIPNFKIEDIKLQVIGEFLTEKKNNNQKDKHYEKE
jgi:hypothetical protein